MAKDRNIENLVKILIDEKELTVTNLERLIQGQIYKDTELITTDNNLLLTVDSLITLNNIVNRFTQLITTFSKCKTCIS